MPGFLRNLFVFLVLSSLSVQKVAASPTYRGFQPAIHALTADSVNNLADTWGVNIVRLQIGDNARMDGTTGAAYDNLIDEQLALFDQKLALLAARNIKVVFALYSPPGGFESRAAPSHYAMFSNAALQDHFIATWRKIITRYKDNPNIYAFDLVNEPAMRRNLVPAGVRTWNDLLLATIAAIREIAPDRLLMVKSLYGDPSKLTSLPLINDANVIYSYHAYPFNAYQHTGVDSAPGSIGRPAYAAVRKGLLNSLARFLMKNFAAYEKRRLSFYPPRLNVGEVAVSNCALDGHLFLDDVLSIVERDDLPSEKPVKRKRRNKKARKKPLKVKAFESDIRHDSYTFHSYREAAVWDPEKVCKSDGTFERANGVTARGGVLMEFFSRNRN